MGLLHLYLLPDQYVHIHVSSIFEQQFKCSSHTCQPRAFWCAKYRRNQCRL